MTSQSPRPEPENGPGRQNRHQANHNPKTLSLTPRESLLTRCLLDCAATVTDPPLQIRFAGGWVRDKLLGQQSDDIDAALSSMTGKEFGEVFLKFYGENRGRYREGIQGLLEKDGKGDEAEKKRTTTTTTKKRQRGTEMEVMEEGPGKIVVVDEDAEKSKHLSVAKMKLFGLEIDLVNLRTEVYAADEENDKANPATSSRTPQTIAMGTPEQDAFRRDATINALFYNLHTDQIEDLTGHGLPDLLSNRIMRTPLEPFQTFRDDPLRVLRLIRFAARLDFDIDGAAQVAIRDPVIQRALRGKISRERVRTELVKAFEGPRPGRALRWVWDLGLFRSCFDDPAAPTAAAAAITRQHGGPDAAPATDEHIGSIPQICDDLERILKDDFLVTRLGLQLDSRSVPWLLAAYSLWATGPAHQATVAMKEAIKATVREAKLLNAAITNRAEIHALVFSIVYPPQNDETEEREISSSQRRPDQTVSRGKIGMALRRWGPTWGHQVLFSLLHDLHETRATIDTTTTTTTTYKTFLTHLDHLNLQGNTAIDDTKPLLNGRQIIDLLDKKKAGPGNKLASDLVLRWQFDHPGASNSDDGDDGRDVGRDGVEACATWLRGKRGLILACEQQCGSNRDALMDPNLLEDIYRADVEKDQQGR